MFQASIRIRPCLLQRKYNYEISIQQYTLSGYKKLYCQVQQNNKYEDIDVKQHKLNLISFGLKGETTIRRNPPKGDSRQQSGPFYFKVELEEEAMPQNILEEIVWFKAKEIEEMRYIRPLGQLMMLSKTAPPVRNFKQAILQKQKETGRPGIIAEAKKASPSKGVIVKNFDPVQIALAYEQGGAACVSVLTDQKFFQGSFDNLKAIRNAGCKLPLLCKEFIVEAYQIFNARVNGADAVLLIAAVLPNSDLSSFIKITEKLNMQCLIEVHTEKELSRVLQLGTQIENHIIGINNRDLQTFKINTENTKNILDSSSGQKVKEMGIPIVGESGINNFDDVTFYQQAGCQAILVGESVVKTDSPSDSIKRLITKS